MFLNYFVTAQWIAGSIMAAKLSVAGWKYAINGSTWEHVESALLWAIGGFIAVAAITVPYALVMAALDRARFRRLQRQIAPR